MSLSSDEDFGYLTCAKNCLDRVACITDNGSRLGVLPDPLAESICYDALPGYYNRRLRAPYSELVRSIHYRLEISLALPEDASKYRFGHMDIVSRLLEIATEGDLSTKATGVGQRYPELMIMRTQLPLFYERLQGYGLNSGTVEKVHKKLVELLHDEPRDSQRGGLRLPLLPNQRVELEMACLLSRLGDPDLMPFQSTEREERHSDHPSLNHDWYVIYKGSKIPVQIKNSDCRGGVRRYDERVLVITKKAILEGIVGDSTPDLSELLWQELFGDEPGKLESKGKLDEFSTICLQRIEEYLKI